MCLPKSFYCLSLTALLASLNISNAQNSPTVAENGVAFGIDPADPWLRKGTGVTAKDLQLDVDTGGAFSIFSGLDGLPTFRAGEGNEGTVTAGNWYRIAKSNGDANGIRTNALFSLRDAISGGYNNNVTFRTGMSDGSKSNMSFTLLSNSSFTNPVFSEVRYLSATNLDEHYLEVKAVASGTAFYSIMENLAEGGWEPVDWELVNTIPAGYTETKYDLSKLFMVAGETSILNIDRTTGVAIDGNLNVNGSPVMTEASLDTLFAGPMAFGAGGAFGNNATAFGNSYASGNNATAFGALSDASGESSSAFGTFSNASGANSLAYGRYTYANGENSSASGYFTVASGSNSTAFGSQTHAYGQNSAAFGASTNANGQNSSTFGMLTGAHGANSSAFGMGTAAEAQSSFTMGTLTKVSQFSGVALGQFNENKGTNADPLNTPSVWLGDDLNSVFEIGIGTGTNDKKNAMTVMQDGTIELGKDAVTNEIPLKVKSDGSVVLSKAQGDISMGSFGQ